MTQPRPLPLTSFQRDALEQALAFPRPDGTWVACDGVGDSARPFATEIEALRYAVDVHHVAVFIPWGKTAWEALSADRSGETS